MPEGLARLLDGEDGIENRIKRLTDRERPASVGWNTWSTSLLVLFGVVLAAVSLVPVIRAQVVAAPVAKAAAPQAGWRVRIRTVNPAGDWVFDPQAIADEIVAAIQPMLRKEWGVPVKLEFRDVERDVYVARGKWSLKPISDEFPGVHIYGTYLDKESGNGSGTGKFDRFLAKAGSWIEMPIINEVPQPPAERFSWRYHMPSPFTQQQWDDAHNPEAVTANLAAQSGLEFVKERRKIRVLFVER